MGAGGWLMRGRLLEVQVADMHPACDQQTE
jgi:hypothetical protein